MISPDTSDDSLISNSGCIFPVADTFWTIVVGVIFSVSTLKVLLLSPNQPAFFPMISTIKSKATAEIMNIVFLFIIIKLFFKGKDIKQLANEQILWNEVSYSIG